MSGKAKNKAQRCPHCGEALTSMEVVRLLALGSVRCFECDGLVGVAAPEEVTR